MVGVGEGNSGVEEEEEEEEEEAAAERAAQMARRTGSVPLRRVSEVAPFSPTSATPKARTSPWVSFCLLLMVGPTCLPLFQVHFGS